MSVNDRTKRKKLFIGATSFFACLGVGFIVAALATDFWVEVLPIQNITDNSTDVGSTKHKGTINFGLFHGEKIMDHGAGPRTTEIWVVCSSSENACMFYDPESENGGDEAYLDAILAAYKNATVQDSIEAYGLFNYGLWVSTLVMACVAILWGLIAFGFALFNLFAKPIETITGPSGLYLWNILACIFSTLCCILYVCLFYLFINENIMTQDEIKNTWTSTDRAYFDFSFWFVIISIGMFTINIVLLVCSGLNLKLSSYKNPAEKAMDGVMMY